MRGIRWSRRSPPARSRLANVETRHAVYTTLFEFISVEPRHLDALFKRGLSAEEISRRGYRSLPPRTQVSLAGRVAKRFPVSTLLRVPGFFVNPRRQLSCCVLSGLLIPIRDADQRIAALVVRPDERLNNGGKILLCVVEKAFGAKPRMLPHVPLGVVRPCSTCRLTEGSLKADVATAISGLSTIGAPGMAWRVCVPTLKALGCRTVRLAFDADASRNHHVGQALRRCFKALRDEGFAVEVERRDEAAGKGIDDVLAAGGSIEVLTGKDAARAVRGAARASGKARRTARPSPTAMVNNTKPLTRTRSLARTRSLTN